MVEGVGRDRDGSRYMLEFEVAGNARLGHAVILEVGNVVYGSFMSSMFIRASVCCTAHSHRDTIRETGQDRPEETLQDRYDTRGSLSSAAPFVHPRSGRRDMRRGGVLLTMRAVWAYDRFWRRRQLGRGSILHAISLYRSALHASYPLLL